MVLYILLILMTRKHLFIGLWAIVVWIVAIVYSVLPKNTEAKEPTLKDQCFLSGSIDACVSLDKQNKQNYVKIQQVLESIAQENAKVKEHTQQLLSWSSFM